MVEAMVSPSAAPFSARHAFVVQLARYAVVGGLGTAVNALIYLILRVWIDPVPANLVAVVLSTIASTEANRQFTFGGAAGHRWRNYVQNAGTMVFYAFYSSTVLLILAALVDDPGPTLEATCVAAASALGGLCRFLVMRYWVFGARGEPVEAAPDEAGGAMADARSR
ncbi:Putative flippase GtrA (transmembrane translocase of bactoprenol-linked glucose) [Pseudonocardia thermophila]|uniref:Putative flippase GtrA (Transmembrane translocase of bactoprenol-linked glucose) n=2 Tax=Pseudonocardia thermophila TaxID=1848 RepID=A0A1M7B4S8_PSETH|nr:Putative flippase GtrA (transmembrane translocase of bactoprenol-linked glucose) [Pseudonocardia thermophila]